jgi:hypothetical protein
LTRAAPHGANHSYRTGASSVSVARPGRRAANESSFDEPNERKTHGSAPVATSNRAASDGSARKA